MRGSFEFLNWSNKSSLSVSAFLMDDVQSDNGTPNHLEDSRLRSWFWCHNVILEMGLSVYEIAVYCVLSRHSDGRSEKRVCFPSYSRLSRILGCSRPRTVQAVSVLIQKGLLKKTPRQDAFGHHSNLYELVDPVLNAKKSVLNGIPPKTTLVNEMNQGDRNMAPRLTMLTTSVNDANHPSQSGLPRTRTSEQKKERERSSADED